MQKPYAIEVEHLTKNFGDIAAVSDVSFTVPEGEFFGFLGPNGAGKTTTLRVLAGVFPPPVDCSQCGAPLGDGAALAESGEALLCRKCARARGRAVSPEAIALLRRISRENLAALAARPPAGETLAEVGEVVGRIRRHFLQHELKSLDVMERTLGGLEE